MNEKTTGRLDRVLAMSILSDRPSGDVLRLERHAERIGQVALARAMGISRQRIDKIERSDNPSESAVQRYRAGLALAVAARNARGDDI